MCPLSKEWQRTESRLRTLGGCILLFIAVYISCSGVPAHTIGTHPFRIVRETPRVINTTRAALSRQTARTSPYYCVPIKQRVSRAFFDHFQFKCTTPLFLPRNYASLSLSNQGSFDESLIESGNGKTCFKDFTKYS